MDRNKLLTYCYKCTKLVHFHFFYIAVLTTLIAVLTTLIAVLTTPIAVLTTPIAVLTTLWFSKEGGLPAKRRFFELYKYYKY